MKRCFRIIRFLVIRIAVLAFVVFYAYLMYDFFGDAIAGSFRRNPELPGRLAVGALLLIAAVIGYRFVSTRITRVKFMRCLRECCERSRYDLAIGKGRPLTLTVRTDAHTYHCVVISSLNRNNPVLLAEEGHAYAHVRGIRVPQDLRVTAMNMVNSTGRTVVNEYLWASARVKYFDFPESSGRRVVIVNPAAKRTLCGTVQRFIVLDNGETVEDYQVYTGAAFCNLLEREARSRSRWES